MPTRAPLPRHQPGRPFANLGRFSPLALAKVAVREEAVRNTQHQLAAGLSFERALERTATDFRFKVSVTSLRRWVIRYAQAGTLGLIELKQGRVGRKPARKGIHD